MLPHTAIGPVPECSALAYKLSAVKGEMETGAQFQRYHTMRPVWQDKVNMSYFRSSGLTVQSSDVLIPSESW